MFILPNLNLLKYGIVFWGGGSKDTEIRKNVQQLLKMLIRGYLIEISFFDVKILTVTTLYIFEILCFTIKNKMYTTQYSDIHSYNTIYKYK
jgi:hypothetical protein